MIKTKEKNMDPTIKLIAKLDPTLKDITQIQYNEIADDYFTTIGRNLTSFQYLKFFAGVQKKVETRLKQKFSRDGYKLVKVKKDKPGVYYKITMKKEIFGFNVLRKNITLSDIMKDIIYINLLFGGSFPDVKIIIPEYLNQKMNFVLKELYDNFKKINKVINPKKQQ